jgi:rhamnulokinase
MSKAAHIAVDLGAESGRVMLGVIEEGRLLLREVHRFLHLPVPTPAGLCWDVTGLWRAILDGLREAARVAAAEQIQLLSVGVDTWGVDFTFVTKNGNMVGLPMCYRDPSFGAAYARCIDRIGAAAIYDGTGIQLMSINSLYQYEHRFNVDPKMFEGTSLLFMPDLFHWLLSGKVSIEMTIASTSQMVDARSSWWNLGLLRSLELPSKPLGMIVEPGSAVGTIRYEVSKATGLPETLPVVAPPSHDTAAAVAAVPAMEGTNWAYLSSGTWSLLGAEVDRPCINAESAKANFTNELGAGGKVRFLKNISGLWLVQECKRQWEREGNKITYEDMTVEASKSSSLKTLIPVNDPVFAAPGADMCDRIARYAKQTNQAVPKSPGEFVRACLESLALEYRRTLQTLSTLLGKKYDTLHIIGGGGKNALLNQMTADACGVRVVAGPYEATASGNVLVQAIGLGRVRDLAQARQIVRDSFELKSFEPKDGGGWTNASKKYNELPMAK